jgi:hypothetical protein
VDLWRTVIEAKAAVDGVRKETEGNSSRKQKSVEGIRRQYAKIGRNEEAALGGLKNKAESGR